MQGGKSTGVEQVRLVPFLSTWAGVYMHVIVSVLHGSRVGDVWCLPR